MNKQGGPNFDKDRDRYSTGIMTAWVTAITITVGTCTIAPIGITISIVTEISKAAVISTTPESCAEISSNTAVTSVSAASSTAIGYS